MNGSATTITPSGTSLEDLANAINSAGAGAQATIVNIGSNTTPDYRLSLTSAHLGTDSIQLNDGTNDLMDTLSTGTPALYKVNGSTTDVQSTSSQITLSPGLTVNLLAQTTTPSTIQVSTSFSGLQNGLSNFVNGLQLGSDCPPAECGPGRRCADWRQSCLHTVERSGSDRQGVGGSGSVSSSLADLGYHA